MINFFGQIHQKQLAKNNFCKYLIYTLGEIILVVKQEGRFITAGQEYILLVPRILMKEDKAEIEALNLFRFTKKTAKVKQHFK